MVLIQLPYIRDSLGDPFSRRSRRKDVTDANGSLLSASRHHAAQL
jgi:hypothetical protein